MIKQYRCSFYSPCHNEQNICIVVICISCAWSVFNVKTTQESVCCKTFTSLFCFLISRRNKVNIYIYKFLTVLTIPWTQTNLVFYNIDKRNKLHTMKSSLQISEHTKIIINLRYKLIHVI